MHAWRARGGREGKLESEKTRRKEGEVWFVPFTHKYILVHSLWC